jgi:hypothetical protein
LQEIQQYQEMEDDSGNYQKLQERQYPPLYSIHHIKKGSSLKARERQSI